MVPRLGEMLLEHLLQLSVGSVPHEVRQDDARERLLYRQQAREIREHEVARRRYPRRRLDAHDRAARSRCGTTVYFGSRADWKPALKTDQRNAAPPARMSAPPATEAILLLRPPRAKTAAPPKEQAFAIFA